MKKLIILLLLVLPLFASDLKNEVGLYTNAQYAQIRLKKHS